MDIHHTPITENSNSTLGLYDVLCGRDKDAYHHVGNRRFRVMINLNLSRYLACQSRYEKGTLISSLTEELTDATSSCAVRFMKRIKDEDDIGNTTLMELDLEQSRAKVAHSLRDAVTQQNKKNKKRKENNKKKETDDDGSLSPSTCTINRTTHTTTTTTKPPVIKIRATTESTSESAKVLTHLMTPASAEALVDLITPIIRDYSDTPAPAPAPASPNYNRRASDPVPASTALAPAQPDRRNSMFILGQDEELIRELDQSITHLYDSFNSNHIYDYNHDYNHSCNGYGYDNNGHENNDNNNGKQHNHTTDRNHDAATLAPSRQQQQRKRRSMLVFQEFAETEEEQHSRNPNTRLADCFHCDDDDDCSHEHHMNGNDNDDKGANQLTFFSSGLEELERLSSKIGHHSASASAALASASASTSDSS